MYWSSSALFAFSAVNPEIQLMAWWLEDLDSARGPALVPE